MKNLDKLNPEERIILSDGEMKEVSGGTTLADTCISSYPVMCSFEACTRGGVPGICIRDGADCYCKTRL